MSQPNFYAIIPATVRYDENVCPNAKLLYGEISAMCNAEGYCWAKNERFANLYNVKTETVSRWISQLVKGNYIRSEVNKIEGNTRKIFIEVSAVSLLPEKSKAIDKKAKRVLTKKSIGIDEKVNSIYDNTKTNNTSNKERSALAFFEVNFPSDYQTLMMQFKSQINDFPAFCESFEAKVDFEGLDFELHVLRGRFKQFALNWIRNQAKYDLKVVEVNNVSNKKIGSL